MLLRTLVTLIFHLPNNLRRALAIIKIRLTDSDSQKYSNCINHNILYSLHPLIFFISINTSAVGQYDMRSWNFWNQSQTRT